MRITLGAFAPGGSASMAWPMDTSVKGQTSGQYVNPKNTRLGSPLKSASVTAWPV